MISILVTGANGQLGSELKHIYKKALHKFEQPINFEFTDIDTLDLSNSIFLKKFIQDHSFDFIINCAAYTNVDLAESEKDSAIMVNSTCVKNIVDSIEKSNIKFIHISTDYVFDGAKEEPYIETDKAKPINAYGRTKLAGEQAIQSSGCDYLIFRTSWVYASRGHNFLLTMLKLAQEREELSIVDDQIGSPTSARLIADTTVLCAQHAIKEKLVGVFSSDLYHLTTSGHTSWHGFTEEIVKLASSSLNLPLTIKELKAIPTSDYPTPAIRPMNSQLALTKLESVFTLKMPDWKKSLFFCMAEI